MSDLQLDAKDRAWRTVLQGAVATVLFAALTAATSVLQVAIGSEETVQWSVVAQNAVTSAGVAALMAVLAYGHRLFGSTPPTAAA